MFIHDFISTTNVLVHLENSDINNSNQNASNLAFESARGMGQGTGLPLLKVQDGGCFCYRLMQSCLKILWLSVTINIHYNFFHPTVAATSCLGRAQKPGNAMKNSRWWDWHITCNNNDIITDKLFNVYYVKKISISKSLHFLYKLQQKI